LASGRHLVIPVARTTTPAGRGWAFQVARAAFFWAAEPGGGWCSHSISPFHCGFLPALLRPMHLFELAACSVSSQSRGQQRVNSGRTPRPYIVAALDRWCLPRATARTPGAGQTPCFLYFFVVGIFAIPPIVSVLVPPV